MVRYALLFKDEKEQISYFYNLENNAVYTDGNHLNTKKITKWSWVGAIVGVFIYLLIRFVPMCSINTPKLTGIVIALVGLLLGWIISSLVIKHNEKYFIEENKQNMKTDQIKKLYIQGESFRRKYRLLLISLFVFSLLSTAILNEVSIHIFILIMLILLWIVVWIMYFLNRPICSRKIKKIME